MTDPNDQKPTDDDAGELERLREHNKQLLAELKAARTEAKGLQDAAEAATARANEWQTRYHQVAVLDPLENDLRSAAAGPWKYLRDVALESKLLTMEPDADGIERAVWQDERGKPADLTRGLHMFLVDVAERQPGGDLSHAIRGRGASGSGASPSGSPPAAAHDEPKPAPAPAAPTFGLR